MRSQANVLLWLPPPPLAHERRLQRSPKRLSPARGPVQRQVPECARVACKRLQRPRSRGRAQAVKGASQLREEAVAKLLQPRRRIAHRAHVDEEAEEGGGTGLLRHVLGGDAPPQERRSPLDNRLALDLHEPSQQLVGGAALLYATGILQLDDGLDDSQPVRHGGHAVFRGQVRQSMQELRPHQVVQRALVVRRYPQHRHKATQAPRGHLLAEGSAVRCGDVHYDAQGVRPGLPSAGGRGRWRQEPQECSSVLEDAARQDLVAQAAGARAAGSGELPQKEERHADQAQVGAVPRPASQARAGNGLLCLPVGADA
mmetsp:Transcript_57523/g.154089  ORF Transcript_57523/g.154089 Transcript_57523/m.154089 type:complete len:314 (+) Transcript_57523:240-1181(+)